MLSGILSQAGDELAPDWRRSITWLDYAEKRYDRVKARLINLLRPAAYARGEGAVTNGWTIDGNRVIVWQSRDAFGRSDFSWEDVPSTLIDQGRQQRRQVGAAPSQPGDVLGTAPAQAASVVAVVAT